MTSCSLSMQISSSIWVSTCRAISIVTDHGLVYALGSLTAISTCGPWHAQRHNGCRAGLSDPRNGDCLSGRVHYRNNRYAKFGIRTSRAARGAQSPTPLTLLRQTEKVAPAIGSAFPVEPLLRRPRRSVSRALLPTKSGLPRSAASASHQALRFAQSLGEIPVPRPLAHQE